MSSKKNQKVKVDKNIQAKRGKPVVFGAIFIAFVGIGVYMLLGNYITDVKKIYSDKLSEIVKENLEEKAKLTQRIEDIKNENSKVGQGKNDNSALTQAIEDGKNKNATLTQAIEDAKNENVKLTQVIEAIKNENAKLAKVAKNAIEDVKDALKIIKLSNQSRRQILENNDNSIAQKETTSTADRADIVAIDNKMWQNINYSAEKRYTWQDAMNYCEKSTLAEHNDWRLPTKDELMALGNTELYQWQDYKSWKKWFNENKDKRVIKSKNSSYFIKQKFLANMPESGKFWTSTTSNSDTQASIVYFNYGNDYAYNKSDHIHFARCVR